MPASVSGVRLGRVREEERGREAGLEPASPAGMGSMAHMFVGARVGCLVLNTDLNLHLAGTFELQR